jgi:hypothetical protein
MKKKKRKQNKLKVVWEYDKDMSEEDRQHRIG